MMNASDKAGILVAALPYIQKWNKKTIVVKYGGNAMINEHLKNEVINDIILLRLIGINVVLVHGGGPEINDLLKKLNIESKFVGGLRYTDKDTMDVVQMVLSGKVNKDLVSLVTHHGGKALGLCGIDGAMFVARKISGEDLGFVGEITKVNPEPILRAFEDGYIPVVASVADGEDGNAYNINADTAASELAIALGAVKLILLTDTVGILNGDELVTVLQADEVQDFIDKGIISGGMIPKVKCCVDAVKGGVARTHIIDGRMSHSILVELLSDEGVGSMIL